MWAKIGPVWLLKVVSPDRTIVDTQALVSSTQRPPSIIFLGKIYLVDEDSRRGGGGSLQCVDDTSACGIYIHRDF